jgi:hypothetical protein
MSQVSYDSIAPLITAQTQDGTTLRVTFTCPVTGQAVESSATLQEGSGIGATAKKSAVRNALWKVSSAVRRKAGYSFAGRVAGDVADHSIRSAGEGVKFGAKEKEAAAVAAFERVSAQFTWDEAQGRWVHQSTVPA